MDMDTGVNSRPVVANEYKHFIVAIQGEIHLGKCVGASNSV